MTYSEKLKDPRWQRKRLEILNRDKWKCTSCDNTAETLHVHHAYYLRGRQPWEYPNWSLKTECKTCHGETHSPIPEEEGALTEWEDIIEWITAGNPENVGKVWFAAAAIYRASQRGIDPKRLYAEIENFADSLNALEARS